MNHILLVGAGGALGSVLRYLIGLWMLQRAGPAFPWGTLFVNVTGSFLIGFLAEFIMHKMGASPEMRVFLITGVLGATRRSRPFRSTRSPFWNTGRR